MGTQERISHELGAGQHVIDVPYEAVAQQFAVPVGPVTLKARECLGMKGVYPCSLMSFEIMIRCGKNIKEHV
ncbi:MAG: hypothetical protein R6U57_02155 [Anaerolineales bacterium]